MKPLSDFFFAPEVTDMGSDMVILCIIIFVKFNRYFQLGVKLFSVPGAQQVRVFFCLRTCVRMAVAGGGTGGPSGF